MRCWTRPISLLCLFVLAACTRLPDRMHVDQAVIDGSTLSLRLQWQPDADVLNALDHGIVLDFVVDLRAQHDIGLGLYRTLAEQHRHLQLRYYPLSRRYQLRDLDRGTTRSYTVRAAALAALEDLRLPLNDWRVPKTSRYQVAVRLDRDALPGALRLPALLRPAWRISSETYTWHAGA